MAETGTTTPTGTNFWDLLGLNWNSPQAVCGIRLPLCPVHLGCSSAFHVVSFIMLHHITRKTVWEGCWFWKAKFRSHIEFWLWWQVVLILAVDVLSLFGHVSWLLTSWLLWVVLYNTWIYLLCYVINFPLIQNSVVSFLAQPTLKHNSRNMWKWKLLNRESLLMQLFYKAWW